MRRQIAWAMLTEVFVMGSAIALLKLAATLLGPEGFGEYALSRRVVGLIYLPLVMGLGIAAPRYIAIARSRADGDFSESGIVVATLSAGIVPAVAVALLMNLVPQSSALLLFGTKSLASLIPPASLAIAGIALHSMVYAVFRGRSETGLANSMHLLNLGLVPLAAFVAADQGAAAIVTVTGAGWVLVSVIGLAVLLYRQRAELAGNRRVLNQLGVLLRYGLPRVPGEFALAGLFAIPALIAVRTHGVAAAGYLSAAMSLLTMAGSAFAPVGVVVLPAVSAEAARGDTERIRRLVIRLLGGGILLAAAGAIAGELLLPWFVRWYFGAEFTPAIPIFRACFIGVVPFTVYILMRNVLDALEVKAVNSRNLFLSLAVLVALCLANGGLLWMSFSLAASLTLLGALTLRDTWIRLRIPVPPTAAPLAA